RVAGLRHRQHVGELVDLLRQALQLHIAAGERVGQIELTGSEDQQYEDDYHHELRQGVDETRPDIDAGTARAARAIRHGLEDSHHDPLLQRDAISLLRVAKVRASKRISLRISCTESPRPCASSSLKRTRCTSMLRRWARASSSIGEVSRA